VEDEALGKRLLDDPKEESEHGAVVAMIHKVLSRLSLSAVTPGPRHLLRLSRVQHLMTGFEAELRPGIRDSDILGLLHPTPATCGLPLARALEWIRNHESFPRGYYAGPIGWMTRRRSCFAVGLRSALVKGRTIDLFAGAGIVEGSDPGREWGELDSKIGDWISLLSR
jgi:menaquinone-specific isochorismate synthase